MQETPQIPINSKLENNLPPKPDVVITEINSEVPIEIKPDISAKTPPTSNKNNKKLIVIIFIGLLTLVGAAFAYNYQNSNQSNDVNTVIDSDQDQVIDNETDSPVIEDGVNLPLDNFDTYTLELAGFSINKPLNWSLETYIKTADSFSGKFVPEKSGNDRSAYIEIIIGDKTEISANPLWLINDETIKNTYVLRTGKDNFSDSKRIIVQTEITKGSKILQLTLIGTEEFVEKNKALLESISEAAASRQSSNIFSKILPQAYAQELSTMSAALSNMKLIEAKTVAGFPINEFKMVEIGADPYPESLSYTDKIYKDGYARIYKFNFIKGTRLEILAEENLEGVGSFIETELHNYDGTLITKASTRISLTKDIRAELEDGQPLFLVVKSFDKKEGQFALHLLDKNQTERLHYVMYSDGTEYLLNDENHGFSKPNNAIMKIIYNGNVEIIEPNKIRYIVKALSCTYCKALKRDITEEIVITNSSGDQVPLKFTKLFTNQILIQPKTKESFEANDTYRYSSSYQLEVGSAGYSSRFGTK